MTEAEIYSGLVHALDTDTEGELADVPAMRA
jgi:hypothetical protein